MRAAARPRCASAAPASASSTLRTASPPPPSRGSDADRNLRGSCMPCGWSSGHMTSAQRLSIHAGFDGCFCLVSCAYATSRSAPCIALACGSILCPPELLAEGRVLGAQRRELQLRSLSGVETERKMSMMMNDAPPSVSADSLTAAKTPRLACGITSTGRYIPTDTLIQQNPSQAGSPPFGPHRRRRSRRGATPGMPPPAHRQWHGRLTPVLAA